MTDQLQQRLRWVLVTLLVLVPMFFLLMNYIQPS
jgi:hypothetical protein